MTIWKNQQLTLILFGITVFFGFSILLLCFLLCPILLSMIDTKKAFDFKYITIFFCALVILILLLACACYIWCKRQKHNINNQFTTHNNVDESDYEYCKEYDKQHGQFYPKNSDLKKEIMVIDNVNSHYISLFSVPVQPTSSEKKSKSKKTSKIELKNSYAALTDPSLSEMNSSTEEQDKKSQQPLDSYVMEAVTQNSVQQTEDCTTLWQQISGNEQVNQTGAPELSHEDSFLPEFDPFDNYLHLVSIETPLSPQTEFFPNNKEFVDIGN